MGDLSINHTENIFSPIFSGDNLEDGFIHIPINTKIYLLIDKNLSPFEYTIKANLNITSIYHFEASEENKNIPEVINICEWLLNNKAGRKDFLLCIGGGITTDIGGFAASIYKRGIQFGFIPTTVLSQTDASLGGKNGVNFHNYKNVLGNIKQPKFTYICPEVLKNLPYNYFISGSAEIIKSFIIENNDNNYGKTIKLLSDIHIAKNKIKIIQDKKSELSNIIHNAAGIKATIVSQDPYETGLRQKLNLGHTFGHAIEWKANSENKLQISHGEAVSIGICLIAYYSEVIKVAPKGLYNKITEDLANCGLPTKCPYTAEELKIGLTQDKKSDGEYTNLVLIKNIGEVIIQRTKITKVIQIIENL